ncbi:MAG: cytotoxic translational repressor of toxin-antitoxin stability system [Intrasporangium sp.]|uniref:cytotoxic translational repressor of toxin-antitoxin stability system n=1 Tax=Intrasporangium sp. TaxID=1925024 RepID=UPI002647777A|nr:cytotoxic translational repressor of toxin-antitoxin stability system [Intrasporangium sp.]MDN5797675.1 cytotoxic translational repressor of toxin-antitoxin stability system [Intrasporangium sp.]
MSAKQSPATRSDHETFCTTEGWVERERANGKRGSHHINYELPLPDGRILYTRISHPIDRTDYGPSIFGHILRDQLQVTAEEFWECVNNQVLPKRGRTQHFADAIPLGVIRILTQEARIPETEVRTMTRTEAIARVAAFYTTGR